MAPPAPFKLSSTLAGHSADVRSVACSPSSSSARLASSSRDSTCRVWSVAGAAGTQGGGWTEEGVLTGAHDGFVNAVCWLETGGEQYVLTGGQDKLIYVWSASGADAGKGEPVRTLVGHEGNVSCLAASEDGAYIVSGSWDKTAIVWSTSSWTAIHTLKGHEQAIWAVLPLPASEDGGGLLTAAADNTIKLWSAAGKEKRTFRGHTQAVRALVRTGEGTFISAGNDATLRVWSLSGECLRVLDGHDSFVYSLAFLPNSGEVVSSGEDRSVRIWSEMGKQEQVLIIPAISVWSVTALPNGDIAAGSSDGVVRVFTRSGQREAPQAELENYDASVSGSVLNSAQVGDVKKSDLPGTEALSQPGTKEGQIKMVKNEAGGVEAHQWSGAEGRWIKVGDVVDAVGSGRKQLYEGKEWDYVFDVDIKEGSPPLKLPFNASENPYFAAQRFLQKHEMSMEYLDQVADFITKNAGGTSVGAGASDGGYQDPYTGASRYTPAGAGAGGSTSGSGAGFGGDPYTGGGKAVGGARLLPHKAYLSFTAANLAALRTKVGELSTRLAGAGGGLSAEEDGTLDGLVEKLKKGEKVGQDELGVLGKMLEWPVAERFPALDLARLVALSSPSAELVASLLPSLSPREVGTDKEIETNTMLALRALANAFSTLSGRRALSSSSSAVLAAVGSRGVTGLSKLGKVALATVALNYSILAVERQLDPREAANGLEKVLSLTLKEGDAEVVYRSVVAVGNLYTGALPAFQFSALKTQTKAAARRFATEKRIKDIVDEI